MVTAITIKNTRYHASDDAFFKMAESSISHAVEEKRISENDAELIRKYTRKMKSEVSPIRFHKIVSMLTNVRRYFPDEFAQVDEDGYLEALAEIKYAKHEDGNHAGEDYSDNTKCDWLKIVKRFYVYLSSKGLTKVPESVIKETKTGTYNLHTKTENDVLTSDEVKQIIEAAHSPKYKAYFGMLYECGARSVELANLRWQDLTFYEWGVSVNLTDRKAGQVPKIRTVPVITYQKYVADWRAQYRGDASGANYVFVTNSGNPIQYRGVAKALDMFAKEAGITKHVSLHRFRHSRITHVLREGMSETLAKKAFWGNVSTNMIECYSHLTSADIQNEFLRQAGVEIKREEVDESPKPRQCPHCFAVMPPEMRFCGNCGAALTKEAVKSVNDAEKSIDAGLKRLSDANKIKAAEFFDSL